MDETKSTIIKLIHPKWVTWKQRMEDMLYCMDLYEPIEGVAAKSNNMTVAKVEPESHLHDKTMGR
ncbi:hypothetical protein RchiOBHm_Chr6g0262311 [Rosa chinensis]|uniref:Uncharacterized protein n=1 Tax=Rosa chinensis TaxID=74649 RepID=A0A2P6PNK6_ROSCH|nr:hypothetical protein RchiOBHm_Chr6g0262311 [Rosa chinensis]